MKLLIRNYALLDENAKQRLNKLLDESQSLKVVYEYNFRLQLIWQNKTANQEQLIQSLKEWCMHAEQTGISALAEFAETIKGYRLQEV
jgi:stearoyl-CoA desaturase (delta-9 desaturase)